MNRSMVAGAALLAGIAIAAPMAASSAADDPSPAPLGQMAQAAPGGGTGMDQGHPGMGHPGMGRMGMDRGGWNHDDDNGNGDRGPMGHHRGWMMGWMHRMAQMSPQQRCEEHIAKRAGMMAYTIAKLNLNNDQQQLWGKVQDPMRQAADKERQLCAGMKPRDQRAQETILDKLNRREQFLSTRLAAIQQVKPALEQFYQSLSPDQKATMDHPFAHR